jgi:hypothetical protein
MSAFLVGLISFSLIFGSAMIGMLIRRFLPEHHLRDDSKDTVKLGAGPVSTVAPRYSLLCARLRAVRLINAALTQNAAKIIVLDCPRLATPEAMEVRDQLRRGVASAIEQVWPDEKTGVAGLTAVERSRALEEFHEKLRALQPSSDGQRAALSRALDLTSEMLQARWLLIEQQQVGLPVVLFVVLVLWPSSTEASVCSLPAMPRSSSCCSCARSAPPPPSSLSWR